MILTHSGAILRVAFSRQRLVMFMRCAPSVEFGQRRAAMSFFLMFLPCAFARAIASLMLNMYFVFWRTGYVVVPFVRLLVCVTPRCQRPALGFDVRVLVCKVACVDDFDFRVGEISLC